MEILDYFMQVAAIPRATGDEEKVSDFLVSFARERGLSVVQDEQKNVIVRKPSTIPGYRGKTVMLQGHMDMVYVAEDSHDYLSGIQAVREGNVLRARGTTLGADNGIALAYCMALMEETQAELPDLELVLTTGEEEGLTGAKLLDPSDLRASYLLNLDSEEEGVFCTSSAGGSRVNFSIPIRRKEHRGIKVTVSLEGLLGGHSGMEIGLERGNAIQMIGRLISRLQGKANLGGIDCPGKSNVISSSGTAVFCVAEQNVQEVIQILRDMERDFQRELAPNEKPTLHITQKPDAVISCYTGEMSSRLSDLLLLFPNGVRSFDKYYPGLVRSSSNMGCLREEGEELVLTALVRSQFYSLTVHIGLAMEALARRCGAVMEVIDTYPQWQYRPNSKLQQMAGEVYAQMYGKKAAFSAIHAGLECGYFANKLPKLDILSFGPTLHHVHTVKEWAEISSVDRVWEFLLALLKRIAESEQE